MDRRLRVAYFSPVPPERSGIADYSATLVPKLAKLLDIELFIDSRRYAQNPPISDLVPVHDFREYAKNTVRKRFDRALYHLGNNPQHIHIYETLINFPGVVVMHDRVLHHLILAMTLGAGKSTGYQSMLEQFYGEAGRIHARGVLEGRHGASHFDFPLSEAAIDAATGVIVHSPYLYQRLAWDHPSARLACIPMFDFAEESPEPPAEAVRGVRARLGVGPSELLIGSFGRIIPNKRIDVALAAFRKFLESFPGARYVIVGEASPGLPVDRMVRELGVGRAVTVTGAVDEFEFSSLIAASDICLNLRHPSAGETSASLIRLLGAGRPTIVSDTGAFAEWPASICLKVAPDAAEEENLVAALVQLGGDATLRSSLGKRAATWIRTHHGVESAAAAYAAFLAQTPKTVQNPPTMMSILGNPLASAIADLEWETLSDGLMQSLAKPLLGLEAVGR